MSEVLFSEYSCYVLIRHLYVCMLSTYRNPKCEKVELGHQLPLGGFGEGVAEVSSPLFALMISGKVKKGVSTLGDLTIILFPLYSKLYKSQVSEKGVSPFGDMWVGRGG